MSFRLNLIPGSLSLAKGTVAYWDAQNEIFEGDVIERGNQKFWADLAGFIVGAGAELIGDGDLVDVLTTGDAAASAATSDSSITLFQLAMFFYFLVSKSKYKLACFNFTYCSHCPHYLPTINRAMGSIRINN